MKVEPKIDYKIEQDFDKDIRDYSVKLSQYIKMISGDYNTKISPPIENIKDIKDAYVQMAIRDLTSKRVNRTRAKSLANNILSKRLENIMSEIN